LASFDLRKAAIILVVLALPFLSLNMNRAPDQDPWYIQPVSWVGAQIQSGLSSFSSGVRGTTSLYLNLVGVKVESERLREENEELRAQLRLSEEVRIENDRLRALMDFRASTKMKLLPARILARDLSADHSSVRINRGRDHGVQKFQGVINDQGVVGYILSTEPGSAQVILVSDRASAIDALVQRTRARGLVSGRGGALARLGYLQRADDVEKGDLVVTSGSRGFFPRGFPIGRVLEVGQTRLGISQEARLETVVQPSRIEEVFVVLQSNDEDLSTRFGPPEFGPPLLSKMNPQQPLPTATASPTPGVQGQ
jgi:rod shape-determining protein MreC